MRAPRLEEPKPSGGRSPGWGAVTWIAIRIDGDIVAEARSDGPDALTGTPSSGALYVAAEVPQD